MSQALAYRAAVAGLIANRETPRERVESVPREDKTQLVARYNRNHAVVLIGGGFAVLREGVDSEGRPDMRLLTRDAFRQWSAPDLYWPEQGKPIPASTIWLDASERRQYEGIVFRPGQVTPATYYNLWRGFAVRPSSEPEPGMRCRRFLDHLAENVCSGDEQLFTWVIGWFAQLVQRPAEKLGTALVLRGAQGTGKTIVGEIVGSLLGPHYQLASDPRYVAGRFNSHLANCLLLQLDEAVWAGDHVAAGKLKDLITGRIQLIEFKGKEPVQVDNYTRLLITSNSDWVVPAGLDERRFAVLDVADSRRQDTAYFAAIRREMQDGGREALLAHLLALDLTDVPLRTVPQTPALREQQVVSLTPEMAWWLDILVSGEIPGDLDGNGEVRCDVVYESYLNHAQRRGVTRRGGQTALGLFLSRNVPEVKRKRVRKSQMGGGSRLIWCYELPSLVKCRAAYKHITRAGTDWDNDPGATWQATSAAVPTSQQR